MVQCFKGSHSINRVPIKTSIDEAYEVCISCLQNPSKCLGKRLSLFTSWVCHNNWLIMRIEEELPSTWELKQVDIWNTFNFHNVGKLLHFILTWEEWEPRMKFCKNASETPHIYWSCIWYTKNDLWRPIKAGLYIGVNPLILEATTSIVNDLDARLVWLFEKNVFWFQITVDDSVISLVF